MTTAPRLRPMSITDMLDASFRLYRANFVTFLGIVALLQVPMTILQVALQYVFGQQYARAMSGLSSPGALSSGSAASLFPLRDIASYLGGSFGLTILQTFIITNITTGALAYAISRTYLGEPISVFGAYRFGFGRFIQLLLVSILLFVGSLALIALVTTPVVILLFANYFNSASDSSTSSIGAIVGILLLFMVAALLVVLASVFLLVKLLFVTQAVVLERRSAFGAIRRSWQVSRGGYWRIFAAIILMGLLVILVSAIPSGIVSFISSLNPNPQMIAFYQALGVLVGQIGAMIALPLQFSLYTMLYYDQRVRAEGYDLEAMATQLDTRVPA